METLKELRVGDRSNVFSLLSSIETRYPGGLSWLSRRFDDILAKKAYGIGSFDNGVLTGAVILTPKGHNKLKLSTIKVDPLYRGRGFGNRLMHFTNEFLRIGNYEEAYVTVNSDDNKTQQFLSKNGGFYLCHSIPNKYREAHCENILRWSAENASQSDSFFH